MFCEGQLRVALYIYIMVRFVVVAADNARHLHADQFKALSNDRWHFLNGTVAKCRLESLRHARHFVIVAVRLFALLEDIHAARLPLLCGIFAYLVRRYCK